MKLNINAKEVLALYNLLQQISDDLPGEKNNGQDSVHLLQIHGRLKAIIIAGLTDKMIASDSPVMPIRPIDSWLKHEQAKVDTLNAQNEDIKQSFMNPMNPSEFIKKQNVVHSTNFDILTDDDDEVVQDLVYPKQGGGQRQQGKRKRRRK